MKLEQPQKIYNSLDTVPKHLRLEIEGHLTPTRSFLRMTENPDGSWVAALLDTRDEAETLLLKKDLGDPFPVLYDQEGLMVVEVSHNLLLPQVRLGSEEIDLPGWLADAIPGELAKQNWGYTMADFEFKDAIELTETGKILVMYRTHVGNQILYLAANGESQRIEKIELINDDTLAGTI